MQQHDEDEEHTAHTNRRKRARVFGINFEIPVTWLIGIIFFGLIQFGVFFAQFKELTESVSKIELSTNAVATVVQAVAIHNAIQDTELREHERRLGRLEH